jgi:cell division protein FtsN
LIEKQAPANLTGVTNPTPLLTKLAALLHHKKATILETNKTAPKKVALVDPNQSPSVQFDFYSELPNMQVTLSDPAQASPAGKLPKAVERAPTLTAPVSTLAATTQQSNKPGADLTKQNSIVSAGELTHLLEAENQAHQFVIQLGAFESETGARQFLEAVKSVGFAVEVIKVKHGSRMLYTVQQGPFDSISVARSTQARMQKRGIVSIIHKLA